MRKGISMNLIFSNISSILHHIILEIPVLVTRLFGKYTTKISKKVCLLLVSYRVHC